MEIKKTIGVVTKDSNLYDELSVFDNLQFVGQLYGVPQMGPGERLDEIQELIMEQKSDWY